MNININLNNDFVEIYNRLHTEYGEKLAKLNGFSDKQLNYTEFIDNFIDKETVADASIDGNANVGNKDIVTLMNEMAKPHQKLLAANKIYHELCKAYDKKTADKWFEAEYKGYLYLHDFSTSSFVSYCFAYDLKDLAEKGLFFIDNFNAEPPKHLVTFVDFVKEFIASVHQGQLDCQTLFLIFITFGIEILKTVIGMIYQRNMQSRIFRD